MGAHVYLPPPIVELGAPKIAMFKILLCTETRKLIQLNSQQLLFEAFFHIIHIFGSVEPESQSIFPFQYLPTL